MHILFIHQNYPAQFGLIAAYLAQTRGFRCTFLSEDTPGFADGVDRIRYAMSGGATAHNHFCTRTFENVVCRSVSAYEALKARPDIRPDLIVAHAGFLSTVYLRELYDCPIVNYFEYFYHTHNSDMDFRPDFPTNEQNRLRARTRNAHLLLDLSNCDVGYSPTLWQTSLFPAEFRPKIRTIFDGVDTSFWRPMPHGQRRVAGCDFPEGLRIVTYVSRGMESLRGFDQFMKAAKILCQLRRDVLFVVVGNDRICYSADAEFTGGKTFKEWVLAQDQYDLSRFLFTGLLPPNELAKLFSITDLHVYLTAPFVLSWSLMNALACGATVLASDTAPVREMIVDGENGLLVDFFNPEKIAHQAGEILDRPQEYKHLGLAGVRLIGANYSLDQALPRMLLLYEEAIAIRPVRIGSVV